MYALQVWVVGDLQDGKLKWQADADSQLTKVRPMSAAESASTGTFRRDPVAGWRAVLGLQPGLLLPGCVVSAASYIVLAKDACQQGAHSELQGLAALLVKGLSDSTPEEVNAHLVVISTAVLLNARSHAADTNICSVLQPPLVQGSMQLRKPLCHAQVVGVDPGGIIEALGLKQKLTPSRTNGFLNIFRLMQAKSARLGGLVRPTLERNKTLLGDPFAEPFAEILVPDSPIAVSLCCCE